MPFFKLNISALLTPLSVYGDWPTYLWGFWLYLLILTFAKIKLFERATKIKFPFWLSCVIFLFGVISDQSIGSDILIIGGTTILLYFFVSQQAHRFTVICTEILITTIIFYLVIGVVGPIVNLVLNLFLTANKMIFIKHVLTIPIILLEFGITYWLMVKISPALRRYADIVSKHAPVFTWFFNLVMFSFTIFKYLGVYGNTPFSIPQYLFIIFLYGLVLTLVIHYTTRYFNYQSLAANQTVELENLQTYTSHIEAMYDDLRRFRHDYKNILLSLGSAIHQGDINAAQQVYDQVVIPTNDEVEARTMVLSHLTNILDLEIKSLVYGKVMEALDQGIRVEVEVVDPIKLTTKIKHLDAVRLIAILFDNAINAAKESSAKKINFSLFDHDDSQYIVIGNSTREERVSLQKVRGNFNGLTTQRHSLGLRNLRIILASYPFIQHDISSSDYWFEQKLVIHGVPIKH